VLRKIFGLKRDEVDNIGYYIMKNFVIYMGHLVLLA
jgi:hypothetical protein